MNWPTLPLKRLVDPARPITYGIVQAGPDTPGGVPYIRPADMTAGSGVPDRTKLLRTTPEIAASYRRSTVAAGDLIVSIGPSYGKVMVVPKELAGANLTQGTGRVAAAAGLDVRFLYWALQTTIARQFWDASAGGATFRALNLEPLGRTPVVLAPSREQRRIADFLDAETNRIDRLTGMYIRQAQILTDRRVSHLASTYRQLRNEHGAIRLRHILLRIEQGWSPQCEDRLTEEGEWGVIKAGCVNSGTFESTQHKALPAGTPPRLEYALREGDLLMSRASGSTDLIGSVGIVQHPHPNLLLCDKVYRLTLDQKLGLPTFVAHMLRSHAVREHFRMGVSGGEGMAHNLPTVIVKNCLLPKAPLPAQVATVEMLNQSAMAVERARYALQKSISLLAERRQALITAAVTGQFNVSTASGRNVTDGV
ncbi:restriction endonuclease subunit S [Streptomyces parvus]|uniref:restriction endonuclease subunit S n=1 Tax=Streptomyces parvus TaxID=66428 RepID=UPI0037B08EBD